MLTESQTPDLEELAAFIDGRLSGERKQSVEERLLRDEDFYEIYLDTVRFQEQDASAEERGKVLPWRSRWTRAAAAAVPLTAAAVLAAVLVLPRLRSSPSIEGWMALLDAGAIIDQKDWADSGLKNMRGGVDRSEDLATAFQLGVKSVELRVALAAGQREAAMELTGWLAEKASRAEFLFYAPIAYGELRDQVHDADLETFLAEATTLLGKVTDAEVVEFAPDTPEGRRFALGAWSEAGRLAALSRDPDALARIFRDDPDAGSVEEIAAEVETLEKILDRAELGDEDFEEAVSAFRQIIRTLAG